jgi:hypothetical protein
MKFKQFLASKGITADAFATMKAEEQAKLHTEFLDTLEGVSKSEFDTLKGEIERLNTNNVSTETIEALKGKLEQLALEVAEKSGVQKYESVEDVIAKGIVDRHEDIKKALASGQGFVEFEVKAVANVTTASGTNTNPPAITGTQQAPLSNVNLREFDVTPLTTNLNTSLAAYPYTEAKPKDGDYSFLAEGGTKPQIDLSWETNYAKPVKAAAWMRLTDEAVQDVVGLQSVATDFLRKKHNIKKSKGILFGDGISPNPKGATEYGRTFVAGDMALQVTNPNFMDIVNACITDIATTHNFEDEMPYMANLVLINPIDFYLQLVSAKDLNGLPLYPQASLFNQVNIGGVTIKPEESIPAGKIFVCDMTKYNTTNYVGYNVKIGWVNDDFIKNQFVILAESRFHAFVKKLDEQAFIYDDIATIKDAIAVA